LRTTNVSFEVTYILRPDLSEGEVAALVSQIANQITSAGGAVPGEPVILGKRRLAYEISNVREGYYATMRFECQMTTAKDFERFLRLHEAVLRSLVIRLDE
jgi:small subunit ribosomal protein S6